MKRNKNIAFILVSLIVLSSCKKYKEDSFISTFSPEQRLTNSSNIWTLQKFSSTLMSEKAIAENNFNLFFDKDSLVISSLNNDYVGGLDWTFESNEKYISLSDGRKFEILQLEVDKLKLKNEKGEIYSFKKKRNQDYQFVSDESIIDVPLFGLSNPSSVLKFKGANHCDQNNISVFVNGSISNNPLVTGLFGNAFGFTGTLNSINLNFSKYFSKPGQLTFYYRGEQWSSCNLVVKINGVQINTSNLYSDSNGWQLAKIDVPLTGNLNFSIQSTKSPGINTIKAIDEIKFWEFE